MYGVVIAVDDELEWGELLLVGWPIAAGAHFADVPSWRGRNYRSELSMDSCCRPQIRNTDHLGARHRCCYPRTPRTLRRMIGCRGLIAADRYSKCAGHLYRALAPTHRPLPALSNPRYM